MKIVTALIFCAQITAVNAIKLECMAFSSSQQYKEKMKQELQIYLSKSVSDAADDDKIIVENGVENGAFAKQITLSAKNIVDRYFDENKNFDELFFQYTDLFQTTGVIAKIEKHFFAYLLAKKQTGQTLDAKCVRRALKQMATDHGTELLIEFACWLKPQTEVETAIDNVEVKVDEK